MYMTPCSQQETCRSLFSPNDATAKSLQLKHRAINKERVFDLMTPDSWEIDLSPHSDPISFPGPLVPGSWGYQLWMQNKALGVERLSMERLLGGYGRDGHSSSCSVCWRKSIMQWSHRGSNALEMTNFGVEINMDSFVWCKSHFLGKSRCRLRLNLQRPQKSRLWNRPLPAPPPLKSNHMQSVGCKIMPLPPPKKDAVVCTITSARFGQLFMNDRKMHTWVCTQ